MEGVRLVTPVYCGQYACGYVVYVLAYVFVFYRV